MLEDMPRVILPRGCLRSLTNRNPDDYINFQIGKVYEERMPAAEGSTFGIFPHRCNRTFSIEELGQRLEEHAPQGANAYTINYIDGKLKIVFFKMP